MSYFQIQDEDFGLVYDVATAKDGVAMLSNATHTETRTSQKRYFKAN